MRARARPLTAEDVDALPGSCGSCLFWELGAACPEPRSFGLPSGARALLPQPSEPRVRKQAWVSARTQEGMSAGSVVVAEGATDGDIVAFASFAPADRFAPRGALVPAPSDDAVLLATVWVRPTEREAGIGRLLVRSAIKEAIRLDAGAVEAYGDRRFRERSCLLPASWLLHEGFEVHAEHPRMPLLRLDVRRTARWAESMEHAWEEVLGRLPHPAPVRSPAGAPQGVRSTRTESP